MEIAPDRWLEVRAANEEHARRRAGAPDWCPVKFAGFEPWFLGSKIYKVLKLPSAKNDD